MWKAVSALAVILTGAFSLLAQDPLKVAPDNYKLQFENELVRVLRVRYAPKSKVAVHDHSRFPAAYIYLSDSGPITFTHSDWEHPELVRRPVKARSFRLSPTTQEAETHSVNNPNETASEFLRIEFRSLKQGRGLGHGRFPQEPLDPLKSESKIAFENGDVRITRAAIAPGKPLELTTTLPALLVHVTDLKDGSSNAKMGETKWLPPGSRRSVQNTGKEPAELLVIEIKK